MNIAMQKSLETPTPSPASWAEFRRQMPVTRQWSYLDHAAVAPLTEGAMMALSQWAEDAAMNGSANYPSWNRQIAELRQLSARLIAADPVEIAFIENTTAGINFVAEGFPWQPGDNIVTRADEFPANQYPWLHLADRGVETRRLPCDGGRLDLDRLAEAIDHRTRIVSLSWVAYSSGWRHELDDIVKLVHDRGALFFLDAIQGLGVFPLDVRKTPVDFLAADGHKWLLGPEGAGVFYLRREHLNRLRPVGVGWNSVKNEHDFHVISYDLKETAERYEGGSQNVAGLLALRASLELLARYPAEALARRVLEITDYACRRLTEIGANVLSDRRESHKSGIVSFELPGRDPIAIRRRCFDEKVILSCRAGRLRISPHAYNDESDIERLIAVMKDK
ncbi:MAG: aminotransferase class V-fold PLP-dependent enzyme [Pirellulales bacterium]|nr:aminotransferase class V-fold PLP-dependent enzyme [Pirellulales bacterium]